MCMVYKIFDKRVLFLLIVLIDASCLALHSKKEVDESSLLLEDCGEYNYELQSGLPPIESLLSFLQDDATFLNDNLAKDEDCLVPSGWFYNEFLTKYYPKAYVIRHCFFEYLTRDELINALDDILTMLIEEPVRYFVNDDEMHADVTHYWEYIIDQLAILSQFLNRCSVDNEGKIIFNRSSLCSDDYANYFSSSFDCAYKKPLLSSLTEAQMRVVYKLYALSYDYDNKMFNEGILFSDMHQVKRYEFELGFLSNAMKGSIYEVDYSEAFKTSKEVVALLSQRLSNESSYSTSYDNDLCDYSSDFYYDDDDYHADDPWGFNDNW